MRAQQMRRSAAVLALALALALSAGCALGTKVHTTTITVQTSGEELLHLAIVPRFLPNGERPTQQMADLKAELAEKAGGYTLVEEVEGGWVPPGGGGVLKEMNDLLLVKGPPAVAHVLRVRLREDFEQEYPFVLSLPIQSVAVIRVGAPRPGAKQPGEAAALTAG
jgi:hypothetical protein